MFEHAKGVVVHSNFKSDRIFNKIFFEKYNEVIKNGTKK